MRYFSKGFSSLIESMKAPSNGMINEEDKTDRRERTASGMRKRKSERKQKRAEGGFTEETGPFTIKSFIKALVLLRDQVIGERSSIYNTTKINGMGAKYASPILRGFDTLYNSLDAILKDVRAVSQREGKELEDEDSEVATTYRSQYTQFLEDYKKLSKEWTDAQNKERQERPVDESNKEIEKAINSAKTLFDLAKDKFIKNSYLFAPVVTSSSSSSSSTTGGVSISSTIKQRDAEYTGADGDIVKEVKKLIYDKFKKYSGISSTSDWKAVYKNYPTVSGTLRNNTAKVIMGIKGGLSSDYKDLASDKTGEITPTFYKILKELKESISHNMGSIASFESFMKSKISEGFDDGAAVKAMSSSSSSTKKSKKSSGGGGGSVSKPAYEPTPFTTKEEGNKFREWVNKKYPDWAKSNSLDPSGSENNQYIRKAYKEYGVEYAKETNKPPVVKFTNKQMSSLLDKIKEIKWFPYEPKMKFLTSDDSPYIEIMDNTNKKLCRIYNNNPARIEYSFWGTKKKTYRGTLYGTGGSLLKPASVKFDSGKTAKWDQVIYLKVDFPEDSKRTKNYSESQYERMAADLVDAMAGGGTTESTIKDVFNKIKSAKDLAALDSAFGTRRGYDLKGWLKGDGVLLMSKKILTKNGVDYTDVF